VGIARYTAAGAPDPSFGSGGPGSDGTAVTESNPVGDGSPVATAVSSSSERATATSSPPATSRSSRRPRRRPSSTSSSSSSSSIVVIDHFELVVVLQYVFLLLDEQQLVVQLVHVVIHHVDLVVLQYVLLDEQQLVVQLVHVVVHDVDLVVLQYVSSSTSTTSSTSTSTTLACPDADADGLCDADDPCTNVGGLRTATKAKLRASRLLAPGGDDVLSLSGLVTLPASRAIDPPARGLRIRLRRRDRTDLRHAGPGRGPTIR
jgi:hypothetical protein